MSKTVSGELIIIDDSAYDGLDDIVIYGNTRQNLWVNPSWTQNGVTVTRNDDGSITVSGTATAWTYITAKSYALRPGTQYTLSVDKSTNARGFYVDVYNADNQSIQVVYVGGSQGMSLSKTFTLKSNAARALFGFGVEPGTTVSGTYRVMLNEGSEAEPWCPPGLNSVGDDGSVKVVTAGKNLAPTLSVTNSGGYTATVNKDGSYQISGTNPGAYSSPLGISRITLAPGEKYYIGGSIQGSIDKFYAQIREDFYGSIQYYINQSFTAKEGATYDLSATTPKANNAINGTLYIQLELGPTATAYEPPNITTTSIDLQGHTLNALPDGTRDELRIDREGNCTLVKRVGAATAPTAAGSWFWETAGNGIASFTLPAKSTGTKTDMTKIMRCDKLPVRRVAGEASYAIVGTTQGHAKNPAITSAATAATVVGGATYLYKLADSQTIDLGKIDLPKLRKKPLVNNVWTNCRDTTTSFYLNTEMELTYRQWPGVRADGFKVSGKHNFWDFASCIASSDSGKPEKKFVTATVPYMSGFYDLSKIYGAIAYESRDVSYTFELLGDDMEDLQRQKTNLLDWLGLVHDEPIYDDTQPNYHYVGSFYEADWEEDETGESGTLTVTFKCQPFLIADRATEESLSVGTHTVVNHGQQVSVFAKANSGSATVKINGVIQAVTTTEQRLTAQLQPGENEVVVTSNSVTLRYYERHL